LIVCNAAAFVKEEDIATYTIKTVDDPRTLNKSLYFMPPADTMSANELVGVWEKMIGKTLEKDHVSEEELLKKIAGWYLKLSSFDKLKLNPLLMNFICFF
jgi:hypothetical protein